METGTFRRALGGLSALGLGLASVGLAACGSGNGGFSWLHPQPPPADWKVARIPSGAALSYPPSWSPQRGDPGTVTAAVLGRGGRFLGYINLTPRQGAETVSNWASFRLEHNADEGDRAVTRLATATGLHFLTGHGACVKDAYTTETATRFIEIACLVVGSRATSVVVGAAPPGSWNVSAPLIERAIEGVRT